VLAQTLQALLQKALKFPTRLFFCTLKLMLVHLFLLVNVFVVLDLIILLDIVSKLSKNAVNVLFRIQESNNVVNSFVPTAHKITQPPLLSALLVRERTLSSYV